jgi:Tfp pilus assembly protein PilV
MPLIRMLPDSHKLKSRRGFTIMEVALAATVLALTLTGMIGVIESGAQMLDLSRKQTIVAQILHSEIDQLRLQSWQTVSGYTISGIGTATGYPSSTLLTIASDPTLAKFTTIVQNWQNLSLTRTVACIEPSQANPNPLSPYPFVPQLLQVTFTISWTGMTGRTYTRWSTTYVGEYGLSSAYQRS